MVQQEGKCVICGKTFIKNCGVQKTCSKECSKELHDHTMALQKGYALEASKRICVICGKEYKSRRKDSKTCSTLCASLYQSSNRKKINEYTDEEVRKAMELRKKCLETARKRRRRIRQEKDEEANKKYNDHEKETTKVIVDINQKARDMGLTYGQYVARYGV